MRDFDFSRKNQIPAGSEAKQQLGESTYGRSLCDMSSRTGWKYTNLRLHVCVQDERNSPWACASLCLSVCKKARGPFVNKARWPRRKLNMSGPKQERVVEGAELVPATVAS